MSSIRIVVVDDQAMIREALSTLLSLENGFEVVGQAADGQEALELVAHLGAVDVVVMDVEMPRIDGITACAALRRRYPEVKVLIVTTFARPGYVQKALDAGAAGYVVKDSPLPQLASAIRTVAAGQQIIDQNLAVQTLTLGRSPLTEREAEVLGILRDGRSVEAAAEELGLGAGTVRNYVSSAIDKTGTKTRGAATRKAEEMGWLEV